MFNYLVQDSDKVTVHLVFITRYLSSYKYANMYRVNIKTAWNTIKLSKIDLDIPKIEGPKIFRHRKF